MIHFAVIAVASFGFHPDLWLDEYAFARKYCPDELASLVQSIDMLAQWTVIYASVPAGAAQKLVQREIRDCQAGATVAGEQLRRTMDQWRDRLRANPTFRLGTDT